MHLCRPDCEGEAPSTRFRHTMAPISPSLGTPLHDIVSEALDPKESISSGQLLLIFGGYNTIGEEFGANSTFVRSTKPLGSYNTTGEEFGASRTFVNFWTLILLLIILSKLHVLTQHA